MKKIFVILFYIITLPIFSKDYSESKSSFSEKQIDEINYIVSKKFESYIEKGVALKADIIQSENKLLIILGGGGFSLALLILFYLSSRIDKLNFKIDDGLKETNKKIDDGLNKIYDILLKDRIK